MQLQKHAVQLASGFAALVLAGAAHAASGPTGVWIDHTGRGAVEITECGANLCGRIVWLKETSHGSVCGTQVIGDVKPMGSGTWDNGWIYDPEKEAKYSVELKPVGADKLRVVGYLGTKFFSETMTWKRAGADLQRCDKAASAAPAPVAPAPMDKAEAPSESQRGEEVPSAGKIDETSPAPAATTKRPREAAAGEPRAPKAKGQTCSLEYSGFRISFPCPE
jgi:uncharacterized protein (DUF2147 family)